METLTGGVIILMGILVGIIATFCCIDVITTSDDPIEQIISGALLGIEILASLWFIINGIKFCIG